MPETKLTKESTQERQSGGCGVRALTPAQKRELELLQAGGGYCHVFDGNLMRIFRALEDKGFVEIEAGFGQLQRGYHVYLDVKRFVSQRESDQAT